MRRLPKDLRDAALTAGVGIDGDEEPPRGGRQRSGCLLYVGAGLVLAGGVVWLLRSDPSSLPSVSVAAPPSSTAPPVDTCFAYHDSATVRGGAENGRVAFLPTEKSVVLFRAAADRHDMEAMREQISHGAFLDPGTPVRVTKRIGGITYGTIDGVVVSGASAGRDGFLDAFACHERPPTRIEP